MRYNTIKRHFGFFLEQLSQMDEHWLLPRSMLKLALMKKELKIYMKVTKLGGQSVWNVKLWTSVWMHYTVLICLSVSGLVSPWGECSPALHSAASTVRYRWCPLQCQSWAREEGRTTPSTPLDRKPWICIWVRSIMITSASSRKINSEQR